MATTLADFSRRPLQFKVLTFVGIGALLALVYWQFVLSPLITERDAASADLESQKGEQVALREQKKKYDDLVAKEAQLRLEIEQNQKALPTESEMPAFFDTLSRKTGEAGVELLKREIKADVVIDAVAGGAAAAPAAPGAPPPAAAASFIKVPVDIEMSGTYYQIKKFMASLRPRKAPTQPAAVNGDGVEEKDRIVTIEQLSITEPRVKNNEIVLTARFTASTFRAKQSVPAPGAAPPQPPAAPPAAPPAGGAAGGGQLRTPDGVSNKPRGMEAKTEKALDASEVRAKKAAESDGEKLPPPKGGN